jgi:hypothetical protein
LILRIGWSAGTIYSGVVVVIITCRVVSPRMRPSSEDVSFL